MTFHRITLRKRKRRTCELKSAQYAARLSKIYSAKNQAFRLNQVGELLKTPGKGRRILSEIDFEIQEKLVDFEEEYPLYFQSPKQLVDFINKLEEQNLQFIQFNQDYEMDILEQSQEVETQNAINTAKIKSLSETKRELLEQVVTIEEEIRQCELRNRSFEFSNSDQNLEQLKGSLYSIYHAFKQYFDRGVSFESVKDLADKNGVLNCLSQIERIIYRMGVALAKEDPKAIFKQVT